jgi:hypothetical protein
MVVIMKNFQLEVGSAVARYMDIFSISRGSLDLPLQLQCEAHVLGTVCLS